MLSVAWKISFYLIANSDELFLTVLNVGEFQFNSRFPAGFLKTFKDYISANLNFLKIKIACYMTSD